MKIAFLSRHLHSAPLMKKYHSAAEVTGKPHGYHWGLIDLHLYSSWPLCPLLLGISLLFFLAEASGFNRAGVFYTVQLFLSLFGFLTLGQRGCRE
jgi:hypothetical protein